MGSSPSRARLSPWDALSAAGLALSGGTLLLNLLCFRRPGGALRGEPPPVSLLVPARNEARTIARCVQSLRAQGYPVFELLVLDDHSEDGTGDILRRLAEEPGAPLRVLRGAPLPAGWVGKNWACHQLAQAADPGSRYLLFTDADTEHDPAALRRAVAEATRDGLALLSLMPEQQMEGWAERLAVSLLPLQILGYLPLPAMERLPLPALAAANGQFMLFERAAYAATGGHAVCSATLAEDVTLAQRVKAGGGRVRLGNGAGLLRCRMYRSPAEVVSGFRRSFASGFRVGGGIAGAMMLLNAVAYLLPFLRLPVSRVARGLAGMVLVLRLLLAWRSAASVSSALAHPLGMALLLWIQALALYDAIGGQPTSWKGRTYRYPAQGPSGTQEEATHG